MEYREVTHSRKHVAGDPPTTVIVGIANPESNWKYRTKDQALRDIESGACRYFVTLPRTDIHVVHDKVHGSYLRTDPTPDDNLLELPDF